MPNVFGEQVDSVDEIVASFRRHGDAVRVTYRVRYAYDAASANPYSGAQLERPAMLKDAPEGTVYPWEQVFLAAAACAGSDYPMLAQHYGVPLERVEFEIEGVFDPRGEFDGLAGFAAPADAHGCYLSLHLRATLVSSAPRERLEAIHTQVMTKNMVLGALRGVPRTSELVVRAAGARAAA